MKFISYLIVFLTFSALAIDNDLKVCESKMTLAKQFEQDIFLRILDIIELKKSEDDSRIDLNDFKKILVNAQNNQNTSKLLPRQNLAEVEKRLNALKLKGAKILVFGEGKISQKRFIQNLSVYTRDTSYGRVLFKTPSNANVLTSYAFTFFENLSAKNIPMSESEFGSVFSIPESDISTTFRGDKEFMSFFDKNKNGGIFPHYKLYRSSYASSFKNLHFINTPSLKDSNISETELKNIVDLSNVVVAFLTSDYARTMSEMKLLNALLKKSHPKKVLVIIEPNALANKTFTSQQYVDDVVSELFTDISETRKRNRIIGAWELGSNSTDLSTPLSVLGQSSEELGIVFRDLNNLGKDIERKNLINFTKFFKAKIIDETINTVVLNHSIDLMKTIILKIIKNESDVASELLFDDTVIKELNKVIVKEIGEEFYSNTVKEMIQKIKDADVSGVNVAAKALLKLHEIISERMKSALSNLGKNKKRDDEILKILQKKISSHPKVFYTFWENIRYVTKVEIETELQEIIEKIQIELSEYNINLEDKKIKSKIKNAISEFQSNWYMNMARSLSVQLTSGMEVETQQFRDDLIEFYKEDYKGIFSSQYQKNNMIKEMTSKSLQDSVIQKYILSEPAKICRGGAFFATIGGLLGTIIVFLDDDIKIDWDGLFDTDEKIDRSEKISQEIQKLAPYLNSLVAITSGYTLFKTMDYIQRFTAKRQLNCSLKQGYRELLNESGNKFFEKHLAKKLNEKKIGKSFQLLNNTRETNKLYEKVEKDFTGYNNAKNPFLETSYVEDIRNKVIARMQSENKSYMDLDEIIFKELGIPFLKVKEAHSAQNIKSLQDEIDDELDGLTEEIHSPYQWYPNRDLDD